MDEDALLAELMAMEGPLPSVRALSLERTGQEFSRPVKHVVDQAKAAMNGASHGG